MNYLEACIVTTPEGIEDLGAKLIALDVPGFQVDDEDEFKTFLEENRKYWDYVDDDLVREMQGKCQIKIYLSENDQGKKLLETVKESLPELREARPDIDFGSLEMTVLVRDENDWQNSWKQYYKPIKIGKNLLIIPEWEVENTENEENRTVLVSNPGMAFGTGTHASTRMCLELLEPIAGNVEKMFDAGCGSGILSIAAMLLGTKEAIGVDIDEAAAKIAMENATMNHVEKQFTACAGNILEDENLIEKISAKQYDLITANIVADVIIPLTPIIKPMLKENGTYIVSGIINFRKDDVVHAIEESGFIIQEIREENGWCAMRAVIGK